MTLKKLKGVVILKPGVWNDRQYTPEEIVKAFKKTDWNGKAKHIFLDFKDSEVASWVGYIEKPRLIGASTIIADAVFARYFDTIKIMRKSNLRIGVSPKLVGTPKKNVITDFVFSSMAVVINPSISDSILAIELSK